MMEKKLMETRKKAIFNAILIRTEFYWIRTNEPCDVIIDKNRT